MTRYETRFLDWPSHFISRASVPEVTEKSQGELSVRTTHLIHSVLASGNTSKLTEYTPRKVHKHFYHFMQTFDSCRR